MSATVKLLTPICLVSPRRFASFSAPMVSLSGTSGLGQCSSRRSGSVRRRRTLSSAARRSASARKLSGQILVVSQIFSRGTAEAAIAAPTSASLPYICAVSTWR